MTRLVDQLKIHFVAKPLVTKLIDKVIISGKFGLNTSDIGRMVVHTNRQIVTKALTVFQPTKPKRREEKTVFDDTTIKT